MINFTEENIEILEIILENNDRSYNVYKALEETTEFNEVILKLQTKNKTNPKRPEKLEAKKEYGDMVFRGFLALMQEFPYEEINDIVKDVSDHIDYKLNNLKKYHDNKEYIGGL